MVLFSIATTLLSWWQFTRREERVAKIELVNQNYDRDPVPLEDLSWDLVDGEPISEWRQALVTGQYLVDQAVVVRNRPLNGQAGFLQLVPFELTSGQILIVERGWLRAGDPVTTPESNPLPDSQVRQLTVRLRPTEPDLGRDAVQGQLASIHLASLQSALGEGLIVDFYGRLVSESPSVSENPLPMPKPSLNEGNHLSYALQWILFGLMAFAALIWAVNNERRLRLEQAGVLAPKKRKVTQAQIDADIEDAQ